jgi:uncharacterized protein (DUF433 family)
MEDLKGIVHSDSEIMGGTPVFAGTRVPLKNLIDALEGGESIEDFLEGFPTVKRSQAIAVIQAGQLKVLETVADATTSSRKPPAFTPKQWLLYWCVFLVFGPLGYPLIASRWKYGKTAYLTTMVFFIFLGILLTVLSKRQKSQQTDQS